VADPGATLVALAHASGIRVVPLIGPSAPLLALMASGFSGQSFRFSGYLPQPPADCRDAILRLETESRRVSCTQIFIETPYRNGRLLDALLDACDPATVLAVVLEVTLPGEEVIVRSVQEWRRQPRPALDRRPAVFLLSSPPVSAAAPLRRRPS
jgi:16S rRNA (cytidine1402-2'-O)-methyltransferase